MCVPPAGNSSSPLQTMYFCITPTSSQIRLRKLPALVKQAIGAIAIADVSQWMPDLPKTRSGKIMRRILCKIAYGETDEIGDTSTLADRTVVEAIIKGKAD